MYNKLKILILLVLMCVVKSYQEENTTISNPITQDLYYIQDNLNNYNILPIIICLYFININI
jgi:hypothetical protein